MTPDISLDPFLESASNSLTYGAPLKPLYIAHKIAHINAIIMKLLYEIPQNLVPLLSYFKNETVKGNYSIKICFRAELS